MAVDQRQLRLQHLDAVLCVLEPASRDAPAEPGEQRRGALLQPDQRRAGHHRQPEPDLQRHCQRRIRRSRQQDAETDGDERDLGKELGRDVDHRGGGCQRPRHAVQGGCPGAEHEAAHQGERQAIGRGVAHHASPDEHPGAACLAGGRDRIPGEAQHDEQHKLPSDDQREIRPADAAQAVDHAVEAEPADQHGAEQQASQGKRDRKLLHGRRTFRLVAGRAGGSTPIPPRWAICWRFARKDCGRGNGRPDTADRRDRLRRLGGRAGAGGARPSAAPAGPAHQRPAQPGRHRLRNWRWAISPTPRRWRAPPPAAAMCSTSRRTTGSGCPIPRRCCAPMSRARSR